MIRVSLQRPFLQTIGIGLLAIILVSLLFEPTFGYRVIESMEQIVNGQWVTVTGRPTWPKNVTIHVYIPNDPQGSGGERQVQAACQAWEEKLRAETNANLTFEYHVGQPAPPLTSSAPPPYVIEVNWTDEETTDEPGTATPISDVQPTSDPNVFNRSSPVYRGQININRNRGPNNPYTATSIYNIALHEFGHIFGLDHKTPDQDSEIMGDTDISDPEKKHPIKDDDTRGLQDGYGRKTGSRVPEQPEPADDDGQSGTLCCAFECGGAFACTMVTSAGECEHNYNGTIQPGTCVGTSEQEQDQGVFGRCNGGTSEACGDCQADSSMSHFAAAPAAVQPGGDATFTATLVNSSSALSRFDMTASIPQGTELVMLQCSAGPFPSQSGGSVHWSGCLPPQRQITVTFAVRIPAAMAVGEVITSTMVLTDAFTRETLAFVAAVDVGTSSTTTGYRWTFTVTPSSISTVSIPMPDSIHSALVSAGVVALRQVEGELPPLLELSDFPWSVTGIVFNPGFLLPWMNTVVSTAWYEGMSGDGATCARLIIEGTIAQPAQASPMPFGSSTVTDKDGDTVPDPEDDCPDVPGDPLFEGCPGYEQFDDSDGDGVPDLEDPCPELPGPIEQGGCP